MIGLLQRVSEASVTVDGALVAASGRGLLVLVAVEAGDSEAQAARLRSGCGFRRPGWSPEGTQGVAELL